MAGRPTPELHALRVAVPRGYVGFWSVIRELDRDGPWTVAMVVNQCNVTRKTVHDYISSLHLGGFAEIVAERAAENAGSRLPERSYRLTRRPVEAPRLRKDGTPCLPTGQSQMWRAIRQLPTFSAPELAMAASTDVVPVTIEAARHYLKHLSGAGYIVPVAKGRAGAWTWRLRPTMNTGPMPPLVMRTKLVWDQNQQKVVAAEPAREVLS